MAARVIDFISLGISARGRWLGHLTRWSLTGGEVHDVTQAQALLDGLETDAVLAERYSASIAIVAAFIWLI